METYLVLIGLLGLFSGLLSSAKGLQYLFFAAAGIVFILISENGFEGGHVRVLWTFSGMIAVGYLSGVWLKKYAVIPAVLIVLLPFLLLYGTTTNYFGYPLEWNGTIACLPLLGAAIPLLALLKSKFAAEWLGLDKDKFQTGVAAVIAAVVLFFGMFQAQYFGAFLIGAGWLTVALALRDKVPFSGSFGLLTIGLLLFLAKANAGMDDSFMRGNFLMGLVAGAAALAWVGLVQGAARLKWLLSYLFPVIFILAVTFMGVANENFGGIPAFIGALAGAALVLLITPQGIVLLPAHLLIVALTLPVLYQFELKASPKKTRTVASQETIRTEENPEASDLPAIPLTAAQAGTWKAVLDASSVAFHLGPEGGVTKGEIADFEVTLRSGNSGEPQQLDVAIAMESVSTLNPMRDETVQGAGYLNSKQFPKARFQSTSIVKEGDDYLAKGNFTFLGKKQPLTLSLRFTGSGDEKGKPYLMMVGTTRFDRTEYGMKSDPKIGNEVKVSWELELRR